MRFQTSDPDIATIIRRIERKTIDLQPNFQRGEVWTTPKKQRLIDTILRKWHVPPIHLVAKGGGRFDVLDGQQRLTAIRDFMRGGFAVDSKIEPLAPELESIHGMRYGQLPDEVRDEFESFAIRVFELHDYSPEEPHELFFRLNQPMTLTEAEKRNAFIGPARNQVKKLVEWAEPLGMKPERLGFSNARMAYDDLFARFLLTLEQGGLTEKVTALRITTRYRDKGPFADDVIRRAQLAIEFFLGAPLGKGLQEVKPNKATIHTWLCMAAKLSREKLLSSFGGYLVEVIEDIEGWRLRRERTRTAEEVPRAIFHDRATARVADVASVVLRDFTGWMILERRLGEEVELPDFLELPRATWPKLQNNQDPEHFLSRVPLGYAWGESGWF